MRQFQISDTIMFITEMLVAQYTRNADASTRKYFVNRLFNEEQVAAINKTNNKDANITTARAQLN